MRLHVHISATPCASQSDRHTRSRFPIGSQDDMVSAPSTGDNPVALPVALATNQAFETAQPLRSTAFPIFSIELDGCNIGTATCVEGLSGHVISPCQARSAVLSTHKDSRPVQDFTIQNGLATPWIAATVLPCDDPVHCITSEDDQARSRTAYRIWSGPLAEPGPSQYRRAAPVPRDPAIKSMSYVAPCLFSHSEESLAGQLQRSLAEKRVH